MGDLVHPAFLDNVENCKQRDESENHRDAHPSRTHWTPLLIVKFPLIGGVAGPVTPCEPRPGAVKRQNRIKFWTNCGFGANRAFIGRP